MVSAQAFQNGHLVARGHGYDAVTKKHKTKCWWKATVLSVSSRPRSKQWWQEAVQAVEAALSDYDVIVQYKRRQNAIRVLGTQPITGLALSRLLERLLRVRTNLH